MFSNTSLISKSSKFLLGMQFLVAISLTLHIEVNTMPLYGIVFTSN